MPLSYAERMAKRAGQPRTPVPESRRARSSRRCVSTPTTEVVLFQTPAPVRKTAELGGGGQSSPRPLDAERATVCG